MPVVYFQQPDLFDLEYIGTLSASLVFYAFPFYDMCVLISYAILSLLLSQVVLANMGKSSRELSREKENSQGLIIC